MDLENVLLAFRFSDVEVLQVADRMIFDPEDTDFAPEPSIGCRLRSKEDLEFAALYLKYSQRLYVYSAWGADKELSKRVFLDSFGELLHLQVGLPE